MIHQHIPARHTHDDPGDFARSVARHLLAHSARRSAFSGGRGEQLLRVRPRVTEHGGNPIIAQLIQTLAVTNHLAAVGADIGFSALSGSQELVGSS
jgi:hypothetical protein